MRINFDIAAGILFGLEHNVKSGEKYLYMLKNGGRRYARYAERIKPRSDSFTSVVSKESWLQYNGSFTLNFSNWQYSVLTKEEAEDLLVEWGYHLVTEISKCRSHLFS